MNLYVSFISIGSILIAAVACPYVSQLITDAASRALGRKEHFLTASPGDAFLKIAVFLVLWSAVSFLLAIPLFLKAPFATT